MSKDEGNTMRGRTIGVGFALVSMLAFSGCAAITGELEADATPTASEPPPKATPTPSASPTPKVVAPRQIGFDCLVEAPKKHEWEANTYANESFRSVQEVWAYTGVITTCDMTIVSRGPTSTAEVEAARIANLSAGVGGVGLRWEMCARKDHFYATNGPLNEGQQAEANGMLLLCPDHPGAAIMANGSPEQAERNAGVRFGNGVREVNTTIQPGLYRTTSAVTNCYWERLDSAGEIIDNNFVSAATQVEITVEPTDFSLHLDGCGEVVKVG